MDFTTPTGRAMAGLLAIFAEFERDILRDRVKAGIAKPVGEADDMDAPLPWRIVWMKCNHSMPRVSVSQPLRGS